MAVEAVMEVGAQVVMKEADTDLAVRAVAPGAVRVATLVEAASMAVRSELVMKAAASAGKLAGNEAGQVRAQTAARRERAFLAEEMVAVA